MSVHSCPSSPCPICAGPPATVAAMPHVWSAPVVCQFVDKSGKVCGVTSGGEGKHDWHHQFQPTATPTNPPAQPPPGNGDAVCANVDDHRAVCHQVIASLRAELAALRAKYEGSSQ